MKSIALMTCNSCLWNQVRFQTRATKHLCSLCSFYFFWSNTETQIFISSLWFPYELQTLCKESSPGSHQEFHLSRFLRWHTPSSHFHRTIFSLQQLKFHESSHFHSSVVSALADTHFVVRMPCSRGPAQHRAGGFVRVSGIRMAA